MYAQCTLAVQYSIVIVSLSSSHGLHILLQFGHKFNPVYQRFCVNFEKQRGFVRALQPLPEFKEYLKVLTHPLNRIYHTITVTPLQ